MNWRLFALSALMLCTLPWTTLVQAEDPRVIKTVDCQDPQQLLGIHCVSVQPTPASHLEDELSPAVKIEVQRHLNEIRREILDGRSKMIGILIGLIAVLIALLALAFIILGFFTWNLKKLQEKAQKGVSVIEQRVQEAEAHSQAIKGIRETTAESVEDDPEGAQKIEKAVQDNPLASVLEKSIARAIALQQGQQCREAIELWRTIAQIATSEDDNTLAARSWFSVGYLIQQLPEYGSGAGGSIKEALFAYNQSIRLKAGSATAHNNRGIVKSDLNDHTGAIADYDRAIQLSPYDFEVYSNRAHVKANIGYYEEALADYDTAIRLKPDFAETHYNRGVTKMNNGYYKESMTDYGEAIRLNPSHIKAYSNRGLAKVKPTTIEVLQR